MNYENRLFYATAFDVFLQIYSSDQGQKMLFASTEEIFLEAYGI